MMIARAGTIQAAGTNLLARVFRSLVPRRLAHATRMAIAADSTISEMIQVATWSPAAEALTVVSARNRLTIRCSFLLEPCLAEFRGNPRGRELDHDRDAQPPAGGSRQGETEHQPQQGGDRDGQQ